MALKMKGGEQRKERDGARDGRLGKEVEEDEEKGEESDLEIKVE